MPSRSSAEVEPRERLGAPALLLSLFDSAPRPEIDVARLIAAGSLFDIDPRTVRVALARLVKTGVLASRGRGQYGLGTARGGVHAAVVSWSELETRLRAWDGRWIGVELGHVARGDRGAIRRRDRALRLNGFAAASAHLWVRPSNLALSTRDMRARLVALGLDAHAWVFTIAEEDDRAAAVFRSLWDVHALEGGYRKHLRRLEQSGERLARLDAADAARESLVLGRAAMHAILVDPWLPDALIDADLRARLVAAMRHYDRLGKSAWRAFYASL